jgi:hypothetical protein
MDLMKLVSGQLNNPDLLNTLGQQIGAKPDQVEQVMKLGMPTLLQALGKNAATPDGAASLANALEQHKDDDVDDVQGFLGKVDTNDGTKMLGHILSGKQNNVLGKLAGQTGLDTKQVSGLLAKFAPMLMGALGKQKQEQGVDANGLSGMLGGLLGQAGSAGIMSQVTGMLDADGDGDIMDDVKGMLGKFFK